VVFEYSPKTLPAIEFPYFFLAVFFAVVFVAAFFAGAFFVAINIHPLSIRNKNCCGKNNY
jgi:hypothetical protein